MKRIETKNPFTGKTTNCYLERITPLNGGTEKKHFVNLIFRNSERTRKLAMVERGPYSRGQQALERVLERWKACKDCGIPVVPTLRITDDQTLIATDMKADGSEIYGKAMSMYFSEFRKNTLTDVDYIFILIYQSEIAKIIDQAHRLAYLTAQNGILLPIDDGFELIVRTDGSWELIILDLYLAEVDKKTPDSKRVQQ